MPKYFFILLFSCLLSGSCATLSPDARRAKADAVAFQAGLRKTTLTTDPFVLTAYYRITESGKPVRIYMEGDGYAFVTPTRVSGNPTPREPMVLKLAAEDPAPNVIYLARPCQYTSGESNPACKEFYWTNGRFSEEVIRSMEQAVSYFCKTAKAPGVELIGYSGGAAVAVLVAARRTDVLSLRTLAGNLDPALVNKRHGVPSLDGSLDPLAAASRIASVPQIHFTGGADEIIPFEVTESFAEKMGISRCFRTKIIATATHKDGWTDRWKELLKMPATCADAA